VAYLSEDTNKDVNLVAGSLSNFPTACLGLLLEETTSVACHILMVSVSWILSIVIKQSGRLFRQHMNVTRLYIYVYTLFFIVKNTVNTGLRYFGGSKYVYTVQVRVLNIFMLTPLENIQLLLTTVTYE
jgi:hypothetical protein